ncbi:MAG: hypothetical protein K8I02_13530, partial [Candidatus Methylomirabilis sp.]|nr:hypothetical protein [Deltaproteobacteria bacterium]
MVRVIRLPVLLALLAVAAIAGVYFYGRTLTLEETARAPAAIFAGDPLRRVRLRANLDRAETIVLPGRRGAETAAWRLTTDKRGLRGGDDLPYERTGKFVRVLVLGDAGAFGWGVDDADAWPAQLEAKLNEGLDRRAFRVLNAAVPGYLSAQGRVYFDSELRQYQPDALVVSFGARDAEPCAGRSDLLLRFIPESTLYRRDPLSKK